MATAFDVADFFIDCALDDPDNYMTGMRVNKLLYFAQGWSLARRGVPLFSDDFQAWTYGPVVPRIYQYLKSSGKGKIRKIKSPDYLSRITPEERRLLLDVLHEYDRYSTSGLVELSHTPQSPWDRAVKRSEGSIMPQKEIEAYFAALPPLREFSFPKHKKEMIVGYRDSATGNYVLPKEWDGGSL